MNPYEEWQQRVVDEKRELDEKLEKLKSFLRNAKFSELDESAQKLLLAQDAAMCDYSNVLNERIKAF